MITKYNSMKGKQFQLETKIYKHKVIKKLKSWTIFSIFIHIDS